MFILRKMIIELGDPVLYLLETDNGLVRLNDLLGSRIRFQYLDQIFCINCGALTQRSFQQGYCFSCSKKLARCDFCILAPHLCHFDKGTCREPVWAQENCMCEHLVYLAHTSAAKVGITRADQRPIRWMDQGAVKALAIMKLPSRRDAGLVEKMFSEIVSDRTNWRQMLQERTESLNLYQIRNNLFYQFGENLDHMEDELQCSFDLFLLNEKEVTFQYPVLEYPSHVLQSLKFDKSGSVDGILKGIKGQYLIFKEGVFNVRNHSGYAISLDY